MAGENLIFCITALLLDTGANNVSSDMNDVEFNYNMNIINYTVAYISQDGGQDGR